MYHLDLWGSDGVFAPVQPVDHPAGLSAMGLLPTQRSKMRSRIPHTCAAAATATSSLPPSNRQRPFVAAFLLLSFLAPANAGVSYRFVLDFAREGQVGAGVGINSRRFSTGKNKVSALIVRLQV